MGLVVSPRIRFLQKHNKTQTQRNVTEDDQTTFYKSNEAEENDYQNSFHQPHEVPRGKETYNFGGGKEYFSLSVYCYLKQNMNLRNGHKNSECSR